MFRWLPRYPNGVLKRPSCYKFFIEIKFFSAPPRLRGATGFLRFFSVSQCLRGGFWVWLWLCYAVMQYAVDVLQVRHIIVCGHFGCGGVQAALEDRSLGLCDQWLRYVRDIRDKHREQLGALRKVIRCNRLCELNVIEQVLNVAQTSSVRDAWS